MRLSGAERPARVTPDMTVTAVARILGISRSRTSRRAYSFLGLWRVNKDDHIVRYISTPTWIVLEKPPIGHLGAGYAHTSQASYQNE